MKYLVLLLGFGIVLLVVLRIKHDSDGNVLIFSKLDISADEDDKE